MFCGNTGFRETETKLNKKWLASFGYEMFSETGKAYLCAKCGYKHEFFEPK